MPGRLVARHDALGHGTVDGRNGGLVSGFCGGLVALVDGSQHALDGRPHMGTLAGVLAAVAFCLTCPFTS